MVGNYKVITLCGSTKFKEDFLKAQRELTLQGNIVISVGLFGHADGEYQGVLTEEVKTMLDDMHKRKIDMADEIFVINKGGYIGKSTLNEIEYAMETGKTVTYMEDMRVLWFHPVNGRKAEIRNYGLDMPKGYVIGFCVDGKELERISTASPEFQKAITEQCSLSDSSFSSFHQELPYDLNAWGTAMINKYQLMDNEIESGKKRWN